MFGVLAFCMSVWAGPALAELKPSVVPKPNAPMDEIVDWFEDTTSLVEINLDPVLRQIVCRVGFRPFSVAALKNAFGLPEDRIWAAVSKLRDWGMVTVNSQFGHSIVGPADDEAAAKMRKWSDQLCLDDAQCDIVH